MASYSKLKLINFPRKLTKSEVGKNKFWIQKSENKNKENFREIMDVFKKHFFVDYYLIFIVARINVFAKSSQLSQYEFRYTNTKNQNSIF